MQCHDTTLVCPLTLALPEYTLYSADRVDAYKDFLLQELLQLIIVCSFT